MEIEGGGNLNTEIITGDFSRLNGEYLPVFDRQPNTIINGKEVKLVMSGNSSNITTSTVGLDIGELAFVNINSSIFYGIFLREVCASKENFDSFLNKSGINLNDGFPNFAEINDKIWTLCIKVNKENPSGELPVIMEKDNYKYLWMSFVTIIEKTKLSFSTFG